MSRDILTKTEYEQRRALAEALIEQALAWLNADAGSRIVNRSFGRSVVELYWEDGIPKVVKVENGATLRPGDAGTLVSGPAPALNAGKTDDEVDTNRRRP